MKCITWKLERPFVRFHNMTFHAIHHLDKNDKTNQRHKRVHAGKLTSQTSLYVVLLGSMAVGCCAMYAILSSGLSVDSGS